MKLRASLKYQLFSYLNPLVIFYGVVILLNVSAGVLTLTVNKGTASLAGNDIATVIFAFVLGLNSVKESFLMMAVNGRTRRTSFYTITLGAFIASACMAAADMLLGLAIAPVFAWSGTLYDMLYGRAQGLIGILTEYGWRIALYGFTTLSGVWIAALYYRMNKGFKVGVSVGVPLLLFFVTPIVEETYTHGRIIGSIGHALEYMFGLGSTQPQPAMFCLWGTLLILAWAGIFWACMRRAEVRE